MNPEARYGNDTVTVMPGRRGPTIQRRVWFTFPAQSGNGYGYNADPNFTPQPTDIGPTGRGQFNMGTGRGRGGAGGGGRGAGAVAPGLDPAGGRGGPAPGPSIASIGPEGRGNFLIAWDPVAQKERWRVAGGSAGFNQGGTLSTAGNLVFSSANTRLLAFRADMGEQVFDITTGVSQAGPPMTFMIDGKQFVAVAGGPVGATGGRGQGGRGAANTNGKPSRYAYCTRCPRLLVYG